ncbi:MAG: cobalamin biosynthesis protein [Arenicella sp.]
MKVGNKKNARSMRIVALTAAGKRLAEHLQQQFPNSEIWFKPQPFTQQIQTAFKAGHGLIFICSTGIVMRTLAPVLKTKYEDPPVLVLDETGHFVVPMLSGHEGGANDLAAQVAKCLEAQLVLTTAKPYLQPVYTVGMGCERNCPEQQLKNLLESSLKQAGLFIEQINSINSIDIKADERGLIQLAATCKKPFQTFDKEQLSRVEHLLSVKSEYVYKTVGVYGVAEAAALVAAQALSDEYKGLDENSIPDDAAELVLQKQKNAQATCAIARTYRGDGALFEQDNK